MQRRSRRRRAARSHDEVELNMAAMLDMAFQLLAFFILTFRPSEIEAQIAMRMPKEKPVTQGATLDIDLQPEPDPDRFDLPLQVKVIATPEGTIDRVVLGARELRGDPEEELYANLNSQIASILSTPGIDGIQMLVSESLRYEYLMQVVDICARQTLPTGNRMTKISIATIE